MRDVATFLRGTVEWKAWDDGCEFGVQGTCSRCWSTLTFSLGETRSLPGAEDIALGARVIR